MTSGQVFFYVASGLILLSGAYSIYLAVMLDKCNKLIKEQQAKIAKLVEPPF